MCVCVCFMCLCVYVFLSCKIASKTKMIVVIEALVLHEVDLTMILQISFLVLV